MTLVTQSAGVIFHVAHALGFSNSTSSHLQSELDRPFRIIVTLVVTIFVSRVGRRLIRRALGKMRRHAELTDSGRARRIDTVSRITANMWRVIVDIIGLFLALSILGLNLTPFLAGATVIGATIGFGAQSLVRDFLSGFLMLLEDQYRIGDLVEVNHISGTVDEVSLRITRIRDAEGTEWYIPNGQILQVGNRARHWSRAVVGAQVDVHSDLAEATEVLRRAMREVVKRPELEGKLISDPKVLGVSKVTPTIATIDIEIRTEPLVELEVQRVLLEVVTETLRQHKMLPPPEA